MKFTADHARRLQGGQVGIIPTDTMYGFSADAENSQAVEWIYELKNRQVDNPVLLLISDIAQLDIFGVKLSDNAKQLISESWPGAVTILLPHSSEKHSYIHRGKPEIGFRLPDNQELRNLIDQVGPLVSTSANRSSEPPATSIDMARGYFGDDVDFYVDVGELNNPPSTIYQIKGDETIKIR